MTGTLTQTQNDLPIASLIVDKYGNKIDVDNGLPITTVGDVFVGYGVYAQNTDATHTYICFQNKDDAYIIMRVTLATGVTDYCIGTSATDTAWAARVGKTYTSYAATW